VAKWEALFLSITHPHRASPIQRILHHEFWLLHNVRIKRVNLRGGYVCDQSNPARTDIAADLQQMRRKRIAQRVTRRVLHNLRHRASLLDDVKILTHSLATTSDGALNKIEKLELLGRSGELKFTQTTNVLAM
jgi:hypothetical protein